MIGRDLKESETVDHKDSNRKNFHFSNLVVRGFVDHGWKTAKQAGFLKQKLSTQDQSEYRDWQEFIADRDRQWSDTVAACRADGRVWAGEDDGNLQSEYEQWRHKRERDRKQAENKRKKIAALNLPPRDKDWLRAATRNSAGVVPF